MLKICLSRTGKRNHATYRVVVMEHTRQTRAKPTEILGSYDPHTNTARLQEERIKHWLTQGAKPSATIYNLLIEEKVIEGSKRPAWKPKKKTEEKQETKKGDAVKS